MLAVFTDPSDSTFVDWVRRASALAGVPADEFAVIPFEHRGLNARNYVREIKERDACIVDMDQMFLLEYMTEFGSIGETLAHPTDTQSPDGDDLSELDRRMLLVSRRDWMKAKGDHSLFRQAVGERYAMITIADGITDELTEFVGKWIADTIEAAKPKIFVSHRSSQIDFARRVTSLLTSRGAAVWLDDINILPGDSIPEQVDRGLEWCTHLLLVIDETFFESGWTKAECEAVMHRCLSGCIKSRSTRWDLGRTPNRVIIPLFLIDPQSEIIPPMLSRIRGIDCRHIDLEVAIDQVWNAVSVIGRH